MMPTEPTPILSADRRRLLWSSRIPQRFTLIRMESAIRVENFQMSFGGHRVIDTDLLSIL